MTQKIKLLTVGDKSVGKRALLFAYIKNEPIADYVPTVIDNYVCKIKFEDKNINLQLWNIAGQEDLELQNVRVPSYVNTDIFLLCFSIVDPVTLQNIQNEWVDELKEYVRDPFYILVGTKSDLRNDESIINDLALKNEQPISYEHGEYIAKKIGAAAYLECSSKSIESVNAVINQSLKLLFEPKKTNKYCNIY